MKTATPLQPMLERQAGFARFPATRYQGSKARIAKWIWAHLAALEFDTVLDAFGGTGCISHILKRHGKTVIYNDILQFNYQVGLALIQNDGELLTHDDIHFLTQRHSDIRYCDFIARTFSGIYYTDDENRWLDTVVTNIRLLPNVYKRALGYFALFQACIAKRPYNLFHRRNLYMRTSDVPRSFGNKATWDRPFEEHLANFARAANEAVFANGRRNRTLCMDALEVPGEFDLVYIDTPYMNAAGVGVDYLDFYHFLEGLVDYDNWEKRIDWETPNLRLILGPNPWCDRKQIHSAFCRLFKRFSRSILAVSYRTDGIPSRDELAEMLKSHGKRIVVNQVKPHKYVLSKRPSAEMLLIGV